MEVGDTRLQNPDWQEQEQDLEKVNTDNQVQETIQSVQQTMSWYTKEANRRLEIEQNTQTYTDQLFGEPSHP